MDNLVKIFEKIVYHGNEVLWEYCLIYLLIAIGLYFTWRLGFVQIADFKHIVETMFGSRNHLKGEISSFQSFCTGLGARVGSGNIAGVAVAIHLGGPGAIFWMWVVAFLGMSTAFAEGTLAQLYKEKNDDGTYIGGPAYYIKKGLKLPFLASFFAFLLIVTGLIFNAVQANTLVSAVHKAFLMDKNTLAIGLCLMTALVITGGIVRVSKASEILVPFMSFFYLALGLLIILLNIGKIPETFSMIISQAFGYKSAGAGFLGYGFIVAAENGIKRGLFSNEAGMGSAANAAATASPLPRHPISQGYIQMFSVFMDTIIICTITALIILLSGVYTTHSSLNGINLTQAALAEQIGPWGPIFLALFLFFFAFTSIAANYSYAESNILYLSRRKVFISVFRILVVLTVFWGSLSKMSFVWLLADVAMGLMTLLNLSALFFLSKNVFSAFNDYNEKRKQGSSLEYSSTKFEAWNDNSQTP